MYMTNFDDELFLPEATFVALRDGYFEFDTLEAAEKRRNEILPTLKCCESVDEIEMWEEGRYVFNAKLYDKVVTGYSDDEYDRDDIALCDLERNGEYSDMETVEVLESYWE